MAKILDKDDGEKEDYESIDQEVIMDDQVGTGDEIQMVNPDNPSAEIIPTVVGTIISMSETIAVTSKAIPMDLHEADLSVSGLQVEEAVSDVLIPVESACNVLRSSDVIIAPPQFGDE